MDSRTRRYREQSWVYTFTPLYQSFRVSRALRREWSTLPVSSRIVLGSNHIGIVNRGQPLALPAGTTT